jgi:hypothetical protein
MIRLLEIGNENKIFIGKFTDKRQSGDIGIYIKVNKFVDWPQSAVAKQGTI